MEETVELLTAEEYGRMFKIHPETVRRLGRQGRIERYKCGNSVRFPMPKKEERNVIGKVER